MPPVTLAFVGDVMLGRGVEGRIADQPPGSLWGNTLAVLRSADAVIANLECAITRHTQPWDKTFKVFHFRAGPPAIDVLRAGNICCVSLANNHILDFKQEGLFDTLDHLDAAGIHHAGAGRDLAQAVAPAVFEAGGLKVGVISFTDNEPPFAAGADRPGTNYLRIAADTDTLERVKEAVTTAREAGAVFIVLSLHWGPNMVTSPPPAFCDFARAAIDGGVDLVHGHSAHLFQAVELYHKRLILYDTGDFLDDYAVDPKLRNDWSFVFLLDVDGGQPRRLRMLPVRLSYAQVNLAVGEEFAAIRQRMRSLCAEFHTPIADIDAGLEVFL